MADNNNPEALVEYVVARRGIASSDGYWSVLQSALSEVIHIELNDLQAPLSNDEGLYYLHISFYKPQRRCYERSDGDNENDPPRPNPNVPNNIQPNVYTEVNRFITNELGPKFDRQGAALVVDDFYAQEKTTGHHKLDKEKKLNSVPVVRECPWYKVAGDTCMFVCLRLISLADARQERLNLKAWVGNNRVGLGLPAGHHFNVVLSRVVAYEDGALGDLFQDDDQNDNKDDDQNGNNDDRKSDKNEATESGAQEKPKAAK